MFLHSWIVVVQFKSITTLITFHNSHWDLDFVIFPPCIWSLSAIFNYSVREIMQNPRKSRLILPNLFCFSENFPNRLSSSLVTPKGGKKKKAVYSTRVCHILYVRHWGCNGESEKYPCLYETVRPVGGGGRGQTILNNDTQNIKLQPC